MRAIGLAALLAVAFGATETVVFEVFARPGTKFVLELRAADGGLRWQRDSNDVVLDERGIGLLRAGGWDDADAPAIARFVVRNEGTRVAVCEVPLGAEVKSWPPRVAAFAAADGGCQLKVEHNPEDDESNLLPRKIQPFERGPLGDFLPNPGEQHIYRVP